MNQVDTSEDLENEWYVVRYSGEIPEIAYHSALYYLTRSKNGPKLTLNNEQLEWLRGAAVRRYEEIIIRDLLHENVSKPIYRGLARSAANYERFLKFCRRQNLPFSQVKRKISSALLRFLEVELSSERTPMVHLVYNCSYRQLVDFVSELGLSGESRFRLLKSRFPSTD